MNRHASSELLQNLRVYQSYYQHPSPFCPVGKLYRVHEIHEVMWCVTVIMGGVRHQNNHNNIMRHYASLCVIMLIMRHYVSLCVYASLCAIMCHYVSLCLNMRHCASLCKGSICVIMRHYASLCVIMRYYGYFESLFVIMRAYFEGVRQMSFIMSRIITVVFFQKI